MDTDVESGDDVHGVSSRAAAGVRVAHGSCQRGGVLANPWAREAGLVGGATRRAAGCRRRRQDSDAVSVKQRRREMVVMAIW